MMSVMMNELKRRERVMGKSKDVKRLVKSRRQHTEVETVCPEQEGVNRRGRWNSAPSWNGGARAFQ
jgi:hypothetical protein